MGHLLGYARVSTTDQNPDLQLDALKTAGCYRLFVDHASGTLDERPGALGFKQVVKLALCQIGGFSPFKSARNATPNFLTVGPFS